MSANGNIALALASLAGGLVGLVVRLTLFTPESFCPSFGGPTVPAAVELGFFALRLATGGMALAAMLLEIRRRSKGVSGEPRREAAIRAAVLGPAAATLALVMFAAPLPGCW